MDFMNKMLGLIGLDQEEETEEEFLLDPEPKLPERKSNVSLVPHAKKGKIVDIHATTQFQVVVMHAQKFDDVIDIADHLKTKKPVVVNMEQTDPEMAQRAYTHLDVQPVDGPGNHEEFDGAEQDNGEYDMSDRDL